MLADLLMRFFEAGLNVEFIQTPHPRNDVIRMGRMNALKVTISRTAPDDRRPGHTLRVVEVEYHVSGQELRNCTSSDVLLSDVLQSVWWQLQKREMV